MPSRAPPREAVPSKHGKPHPHVPVVPVVLPTATSTERPTGAGAEQPRWHNTGDASAVASADTGVSPGAEVGTPSAADGDSSGMPPRSQPSAFLTFLVVLTFVSLFAGVLFLWHNPEKSTVNVLAYAWITTASTGVGALPFFCVTDMSRKWLGVANAVAGGMMSAASFGLIMEALEDERLLAAEGQHGVFGISKVLLGMAAGVGFMLWSKKRLEEHGDMELGNLSGASAQRALLIIGVMTLHSFAEGLVRAYVCRGRHFVCPACCRTVSTGNNSTRTSRMLLPCSGRGLGCAYRRSTSCARRLSALRSGARAAAVSVLLSRPRWCVGSACASAFPDLVGCRVLGGV
jgi:hypothetical protein